MKKLLVVVALLVATSTMTVSGIKTAEKKLEEQIQVKIEEGTKVVAPQTDEEKVNVIGKIETLDVVEPVIGDVETLDVVEPIVETPVYEEIPTYEEVEEQTDEEEVVVASAEKDEPVYTPEPSPEPTEPPVDKEVVQEKEVAPEGPTLGLDGEQGPPSEEAIKEAFPEGKY